MNGMIQKLVFAFVLCAAVSSNTVVYAEDGTPAVNLDTRIPVMLRPNERTRVLNDMRKYLTGMKEMFSALSQDDTEKVAITARALGKINIYEAKLMFPTKSAVRFRELSALVHEDFERLADRTEKLKDAKDGLNVKETMGQLAETMKLCISCHENFRLMESAHSN